MHDLKSSKFLQFIVKGWAAVMMKDGEKYQN